MQVHNDAGVLFVDLLLIVSLNNDCEEQSFNAERRLDYIRNIALVRCLIKVVKRLAACVDVLGEVVVGSVRNAPKPAPAEGEQLLKVGSGL